MSSIAQTFFAFESDFVQSLRCIPMQVRYRLDTVGVKLKLEHWHTFSVEERETLVTVPCETPDEIAAYRQTLREMIAKHSDTPAKDLPVDANPPWSQDDKIPADVTAQAEKFDVSIPLSCWATLSPLERFALCKLSRPGHENRNFLPALREFKLISQ